MSDPDRLAKDAQLVREKTVRDAAGTNEKPGAEQVSSAGTLGNRAMGALLCGAVPFDTRGRPLDEVTRADMEEGFDTDFGSVRVHVDGEAAATANALGANAFTVSEDVVFATGKYSPDTLTGRRLLAHELTHVLQQRRGTIGSGEVEQGHKTAESEASATSADVSVRHSVSVHAGSTGIAQLDSKDDDDPVLRAYMNEQKKKENPPVGSPEWVRRFQGQPQQPGSGPAPFDDSKAHTPQPKPKAAPSLKFTDVQVAKLRAWAEVPAVDPPRTGTPPAAEPTKTTTLLGLMVEFGMMEIKFKLDLMLGPRFFEFGHARRGFVAGMTGLPLAPPTDEFDLKEWKRGDDVAGVVMIAGEIASRGAGPRPPGAVAPAGGGRPSVRAAPAGPAFAPGLHAQSTKPQGEGATTDAPPAGGPPTKQTDEERRAQIAKNPSRPSPTQQGETPQQAKERTDKAREGFEKSGGTVEKITGAVQDHHVVSNKAPNSPACKESMEILKNARTSPEQPDLLTSKENLVGVEDHGDAHGEDYHVIVRNRLKTAVEGKTPHTPEYREAVLSSLRQMKSDCQTKGTQLNRMTIKVNRGGVR